MNYEDRAGPRLPRQTAPLGHPDERRHRQKSDEHPAETRQEERPQYPTKLRGRA